MTPRLISLLGTALVALLVAAALALEMWQPWRAAAPPPAPVRVQPSATARPTAPPSADRIEARDLTRQSREAAERGDRTKARELAERAVRVAPGDGEAWTQLARAYATIGAAAPGADEFYGNSALERRAIEAGAQAVQLAPGSGPAHAINAAALTAVGRYDQALAAAERALALSPEDSDVLTTVGNVVYPRVGEAAKAVATMRRALAGDPSPSAAALAGFGRSLFWSGEHEEAVKVLRRCVALAPQDAACRLNLIAALTGAGQRDEARALVPEFLKLVPGYSLVEDADIMSRRYNSSPQVEKFTAALRAAGVPE